MPTAKAHEGVSAILVAAGESKRMGNTNKLRLQWQGCSLLRHTTRCLLASSVTEIIVVLGHDADWAARELSDLPVRVVINAEYQTGQQQSVALGLAGQSATHNASMICLADMPLLTVNDYDRLIEHYLTRATKPILVPYFNDQRGNPVIISAAVRNTISGAETGCRRFIDRHPDDVERLTMHSDHVIRDIDTADDWRAVNESQ